MSPTSFPNENITQNVDSVSQIFFFLLNFILLGVLLTIIVLAIRALLRCDKSKDVQKDKAETCKSLGEVIKEHL
jgi:hypothetical protein